MKQKTNDFITSIIFIAFLVFVASLFVFSLIYLGEKNQRKRCLDSQNARRSLGSICQEYMDDEWVTIDANFNEPVYNDAGAKLKSR